MSESFVNKTNFVYQNGRFDIMLSIKMGDIVEIWQCATDYLHYLKYSVRVH